MNKQLIVLLFLVLIFNYECNTSTEPDKRSSVAKVSMQTDSTQYHLISGSAAIQITITNATDSTLIFPSCGKINKRIDIKNGKKWSKGYPEWNSPCPAFLLPFTYIKSDSSYFDITIIDTKGTFRIVTIYGGSTRLYSDTLYSNEFRIL